MRRERPQGFSPLDARNDFPIFEHLQKSGKPCIYLDSAATTQKPYAVLDALQSFLAAGNANVHRGIYHLAEEADRRYEDARLTVARFLRAGSPSEIIFTHGATESLNMVAFSWAENALKPGDRVIISALEHHSNFVPWQMLAKKKGVVLDILSVTPEGAVDRGNYLQALERKPALVSLTGMSNVTGAVMPVAECCALAHEAGALFCVDAAQLVAHRPLDVQEMDVDFLAFSAHKLYGPFGVGILYAKGEHLEHMTPLLGGGGMVQSVDERGFTASPAPHGFEAGTPPIAEAVGLAAALDYLEGQGREKIISHENRLYQKTLKSLAGIKGLDLVGESREAPLFDSGRRAGAWDERAAVASFTMKGLHPHDVAQLLDMSGIAVRAGHHCAIPLHNALRIPASVRVSLALYSTDEDVDALCAALAALPQA
jgi:cysteine desulfurase/selenocysteine lyase